MLLYCKIKKNKKNELAYLIKKNSPNCNTNIYLFISSFSSISSLYFAVCWHIFISGFREKDITVFIFHTCI